MVIHYEEVLYQVYGPLPLPRLPHILMQPWVSCSYTCASGTGIKPGRYNNYRSDVALVMHHKHCGLSVYELNSLRQRDDQPQLHDYAAGAADSSGNSWRPRLSGGCSVGVEQSASTDQSRLVAVVSSSADKGPSVSAVVQLTSDYCLPSFFF